MTTMTGTKAGSEIELALSASISAVVEDLAGAGVALGPGADQGVLEQRR